MESFRNSMRLRETADYRSDFSEEGALSAIERAEKMLKKAEEILTWSNTDRYCFWDPDCS